MKHPLISEAAKHLDSYYGALLGLAVGDCLGAAVEFQAPNTFEPVTTMRGGGVFRLQPGEWTDDTSMMLCLALSLCERNGFDAKDQMQRYVRWYKEGYCSSTGDCFDIGNTIREALEHFIRTGDALSGKQNPHGAGNGSLMRIAPIALAYYSSPEDALNFAAQCSYTTHGAREAADACRFFTGLLIGAVQGTSKDDLLSPDFEPYPGAYREQPLCPAIADVAAGTYKQKQPPDIVARGYVVPSLEAALWAFYSGTSFQESVLKAVNLGNDADTVGAITGQLAGAYYGASAIPSHWREELTEREFIEEVARTMFTKFHRPFPRSYWVESGLLLAGFNPGSPDTMTLRRKLSALLNSGVTCFINLMEESETDWKGNLFTPYHEMLFQMAAERNIKVSYTRISIVDQSIPSVETMHLILRTIEQAHQDGQCVYLHCWGGKGRTGTVVGCRLVAQGMKPDAALKHIQTLRNAAPDEKAYEPAPENEEQRSFVKMWAL